MLPGVKKLAKRHSVDATALDKWLNAARDEYRQNRKHSAKSARKKDVRISLEPIIQQATELQHGLENLTPQIQQSLDYWPVGEDSLLGNLKLELPFLADRATEVTREWKKNKPKNAANNTAIMRIAQAWRRLTGMPASYKKVRDRSPDTPPDDPEQKYYSGELYGEFLDFYTTACDIVGMKDREGQPISPDVAVEQFIEFQEGNLTLP